MAYKFASKQFLYLAPIDNYLKEVPVEVKHKWRRMIAYCLYKSNQPMRCFKYVTAHLV
jgi:hypothetical protein